MEAEKVAFVIFGGFFGTAAFDFEMFDVIADELCDIHKDIIARFSYASYLWVSVLRWG